MKKVLLFSLIMFIFSVMNIMAANTWYVDPSGQDDGSHGTIPGSGAFLTIQYAINDSRVESGDIINVAVGTYDVALTIIINKGVTITGPGSGIAKVRNTAVPTPIAKSTTVFEIAANNVIIEKMDITVATSTAYNATLFDEFQSALIRVQNGAHLSGIIIRNNKIYVPVQPGSMTTWGHLAITLSDNASDGANINSNSVYNTRNGIVIRSHDYANITNNTIYNTKGGIMNYTADQMDSDNRIMTGNSWGSAHNEWDIVWNTFACFDPNYQISVLALSNANNSAYVTDRRATGCPSNLTGNRSHVFVNATTGTLIISPVNGNINLPYATIALGIEAVVPGGKVLVAAGTYTENVIIGKALTIIGAGIGTNPASNTIITQASSGPGIIINASNVTVSYLRVQNCTIGGFTDDGISIMGNGTASITIDHVAATGNGGGGVNIPGSAERTVSNIVVSNCELMNNNNAGLEVYTGINLDGLLIDGCTINDNILNGIMIYGEAGARNITIQHTNLDNNANGAPLGAGYGGITLYGLTGAVTFHDVHVNVINSDYGIQIGGDWDLPVTSAPAIALNQVHLTGAMINSGLTFQHYTSMTALSFSDVILDVAMAAGVNPYGARRAALNFQDIAGNLNLGNTLIQGVRGTGSQCAFDIILSAGMNADATNVIFGTLNKTLLTDNFVIEDRVLHKVDDLTLGLATWVPLNVYVTPASGKIQLGIDAASANWTVNVAAGTYNEYNININKAVTIKGANADIPSGSRGPESKIQDLTSSGAALINTLSDGITINGFELTSTSANNAIYCGNDGPCNLNIKFNNIHDIGTARGSGNVYAINYRVNNPSPSNVNISDNIFNEVFNATSAALGHSAAIWLGQSTANGTVSNLTIERNTISNIKTGLNSKEASGIYIGVAWGAGTGKVQSPVIRYNSITDIKGGIAYAIQLSGKTPGAIVSNNTINNITNLTTPSTAAIGVAIPSTNTGSATISVNNNSITNVLYVITNGTTNTVDAINNWWGTAVESQIQAKLFGPVTYDPWIGKAIVNLQVSVTSTPIDLPGTGATIQFGHLGSNNVNPTISVQRINGLPGTPASAGTPIPVYLQITPTNLANYTFEATIVLDVSTIAGFDANTVVMMSPNGTTGWVGANGIYNASNQTYTFTTNHFSTIAFVNPVLSNEINLYVSTSTTSYSNTVYPNIGWNTSLSTVPDGFDWTPSAANHDWTYKVKTGTFYIIPVGSLSSPRSFNAATIKLIWNPSVVSGLTVTQGDFFNQGGKPTLFTTNSGANWVTIDASCLTQNQTPDGSKYIAKLDFAFNGTESGFSPIAIDAVTLLYMDGSNEYEVTTVTQNMGGKLKCYLGDFASTSPASLDMGDGLIDPTDLTTSGFTQAYWSNHDDNNTKYLSKFDVGPTTPARYYFGKPVPDGTIGFEDLAIFAMGFSKTGSGTLPDNPKPIVFSLDKISKDASGTLRLPVRISGSVNDVRAYSMKLNYSNDMEYKGVEMSGEMLEGTNFLIGKNESGKVYSDGATFGKGLTKEGIIAYVLFNEKAVGNHSANIESIIARNSGNLDLEVNFAGMNNGVGVPKTFSLNQNYPNPFNPVTKIEYALPNDVKVSIKIYDMLGREVSVLVNDMQKAGYYKIDWNGSSLASGAYFYKMVAGDFVAVKKMMLIK